MIAAENPSHPLTHHIKQVQSLKTQPFEQNIQILKEALQARIDDKRSIGYSVAVINAEGHTSFGLGTMGKDIDTPITNDSLFEIGSITKTFTAILLADMVNKQEVSLDAPVNRYLPEGIKAPSRNGKDITLLDLATHRSGLPRMPDNFRPANPLNPFADYSPAQLYDFLNKYKLPRDIGEKAEYSNLGMGLLAHALSLKAGKPYETLLQERIFTPLGMKNSFVDIPKSAQNRLSNGHNIELTPVPHWDFDVLAGAGAITSSADDMLKFLNHAAQRETSSQLEHIEHAITLSQQPRNNFAGASVKIGLAWLISPKGQTPDNPANDPQPINSEDQNGSIIWHNGATYGFQSFLGFDDATGRGIYIASNAHDDVDAIGNAVLKGDYKSIFPKSKQEISFTGAEIKEKVGVYPLAPGFNVTISEADGQFYLQATNQPQFPIFPSSKNDFFLKVVEATINFKKDKDGKVTLTLLQGGQRLQGVKQN
jgi:CubicO group peptidase (beta-lactamase class C family)